MAKIVQEKNNGMNFAEQQLLRYGWEQGKGLGRNENGISEAIKVKVKCGKEGVGHKKGEQFTFKWWDHVFNKASASLQVESDQNGVKLTKTVDEVEDGLISNKKPRKASLAKDKLYGCFIKSATLLSGQEQQEQKSSDLDDSSSSEEDERLDLSTTTKLTDDDLVRVCGGRTAHKGARHGLTMSAKLARLEQQEAEFMAKYSKKSQPAPPDCSTPYTQTPARSGETAHSLSRKKEKKKNPSRDMHENPTELNGFEFSESPQVNTSVKKMKKKRTAVSSVSGVDSAHVEELRMLSPHSNGEENHTQIITKRKHKKRINREGDEEMGERPDESAVAFSADTRNKKKKKSSGPAGVKCIEMESTHSETVLDCLQMEKKKKKTKTDSVTAEKREVMDDPSTEKKKIKKHKLVQNTTEGSINEEEGPLTKQNKKKSKK